MPDQEVSAEEVAHGLTPEQLIGVRLFLFGEGGPVPQNMPEELAWMGLMKPTCVTRSEFNGRVGYHVQYAPTELGQSVVAALLKEQSK